MPRRHTWFGRSPVIGSPAKLDRAAVRGQKAVDDVEQRRLAGAVRADDAVEPALGHGEVDPVERAQPAERDADIAQHQQVASLRRRHARQRRHACDAGFGRRRHRDGGARHRGPRPPSRQPIAHPPVHALRRQQDDRDDRDAVNDALDARQYAPSSAFSPSASGTSTAAPITGPHRLPTPPNSARISACAETSMPNTLSGVTTSMHDPVQPAGDRGERARQHQRQHLPAPGIDAGGLGGRLVLLDRGQRHAEPRILDPQRDQQRNHQQRQRQHDIDAPVGELHVQGRRLALHRQRQLLIAEPLEHVEDRQRIGEHRQREIMAAQAEGRIADQRPGGGADHARRAGSTATASGETTAGRARPYRRRAPRTRRARTRNTRVAATGCSRPATAPPTAAPRSARAGNNRCAG